MLRSSVLILTTVLLNLAVAVYIAEGYSRDDFPPGFIFGAGTTAYQVEGAANEDGRTPSIWDTFAHSGTVKGNGDVACDEYHKYKEDVQLMVETGLEAYRFSISWSRLIPYGRGSINLKGLQYYNNLINELIRNGPASYEYGGWISRKIIKDFTVFADVCFREFGDRVLYWTTVNEPNIVAMGGYDTGFLPPGRCSAPFGFRNCSKGNSSSEPYLVAHHMLLAHASAARLYKKKYQGSQNGFIGLSINTPFFVPMTNSSEDAVAVQRARDFMVGWIAHPLVFGDYPTIMKQNVGSRLPVFSSQESKLVKGSFDFFGVLYYSVYKVKDWSSSLELENRDFVEDMAAYVKGQRTRRSPLLEDMSRVKFLQAYIGGLLDAIRNGSNTRGYFVWSFLDLFELLDGYESSYGLYYVDLDDPELKRYPKHSADWYSNFLKGGLVMSDGAIRFRQDSSIPSINNLYQ
ncbi:hypothetical protein Tsubulata_029365 [Turnera subulata]|uniref:Beta-glucosidase n=1 Tax=Turnera subulata TaxID=218843 RepID=A0A9Q0F584_9ROSI|nr:hypothetical protein Tsubulata_029365 [Turnera subulata]